MARNLIPENGAYDIRDGLLDDDGNAYMRGPTSRLTTTQLGGSAQLMALFEAQFTAGRRLVAISGSGGGSVLGVVNALGTGWNQLSAGALGSITGGGLAAQLGDLLFIPTSGGIYVYGGSRKQAPAYAVGSVTVTAGSAVVTGLGTSWLANVDAGGLLVVPGQSVVAVVKSVDTNLQVTLTQPWAGVTAGGAGYGLGPLAITAPLATSVATAGGRLLVGEGRKVKLSNTIDQNTGASRPLVFDATDYHEFPGDVVGMATLRDVVYVFTRAGVWSISNVGLPIVDAFGNAQHRVQKISGDVVLRSPGGLAPWRDSLIVCAVDGVYVMSAVGTLELVSRSITPLWQSWMAQGFIVGQVATFRDHVFIPVGGGLLVGRLDRRTKTPVGSSAPWTRFAGGEPTSILALAVQDPYGTPRLVGGSAISGYLLDLTGVFGSGALAAGPSPMVDSNGVAFGIYLETREFLPGGGLTAAFVRQLLLDYESSGGAVSVSVSKGFRATPAASPTYDALATAPAGNFSTQAPRAVEVRKTARRLSFVFQTTGSCPGVRFRGFSAETRERGLRR